MIALRLVCIALIAAFGSANAQPKKPKLPPGLDPGGVAVVLMTTGIDYTKPAVASRLARDGEGDLIGLDTLDGGNRPYAADGEGTALALALLAAPGIRIIPVRINPDQPASLIAAVKFAAVSPARIIVMPQFPSDTTQRAQLLAGLAKFTDRIFIVPAQSGVATANVLAIGSSGDASPAADLLVDQDPPSIAMAAAHFIPALLSCGSGDVTRLTSSKPSLAALMELVSNRGGRAAPDPAAACLVTSPSH